MNFKLTIKDEDIDKMREKLLREADLTSEELADPASVVKEAFLMQYDYRYDPLDLRNEIEIEELIND